MAPSTERSASRLCGSVRSTVAIASAIELENEGVESSRKTKSQVPNQKSEDLETLWIWDLGFEIWDLPLSRLAFLDDLHFQRRGDFAMQLQRHVVFADRLNGFRQDQLAPIDVESLRLEEFGDVG